MKNKYAYLILFLVILGIVICGVSKYLWLQPEPYIQVGDRVFVLDERAYGNIEDVFEWTGTVGISYDSGNRQQHSFSGIIKLNDSRYLEISDFSVYPLSIPWRYVESFKSYHANPPTNDIKGYCIDVYGGYKDRFTCYSETDEETVYFSVDVVDVSVWKLQKTLDNKTNLDKSTTKSRKSSQDYHDYIAIDYTLLEGWMDYYGLKYNNRSLVIEDFDEIKKNAEFMSEYCSIYGYSGYDRGRGCYRVY